MLGGEKSWITSYAKPFSFHYIALNLEVVAFNLRFFYDGNNKKDLLFVSLCVVQYNAGYLIT